MALGDPFGAIDDYSQALAIQPNNLDAYAARGEAYLAVGQIPSAYEDFSRAIIQGPNQNNPELFLNRGMVRARLGDSLGARRDFEQAANLYLQQGNAAGYRQTLDQMANL
jgi:tetratricopeptide (TPR) repeat protein